MSNAVKFTARGEVVLFGEGDLGGKFAGVVLAD